MICIFRYSFFLTNTKIAGFFVFVTAKIIKKGTLATEKVDKCT